MSFSDQFTIVIVMFLFIVVSLTALYIWHISQPLLPSSNFSTNMNTSITKTVSFWNTSFAAVFILLGIASIVLTFLLASNPALLAAWIFINMITLFLWDQLNDVLTIFLATPMNDGSLNLAVAFFQTGLPMLIPIINLVMGIAIFGKRVFT